MTAERLAFAVELVAFAALVLVIIGALSLVQVQ